MALLSANLKDLVVVFQLSLLTIPLLLALSLRRSTRKFRDSITKNDLKTCPPPAIPSLLPLISHTVSMVWSPLKFITGVAEKYSWKEPLRARLGLQDVTIVANPSQIQSIFRSSKQLSSKPGVMFALKYILNSPSRTISFYMADNSGMAVNPVKGTNVRHSDRINFHQAHAAQQFLSSPHLAHVSDKYMEILERDLASLSLSTDEWVEYPDLYHFFQVHLGQAITETLVGSTLLERSPNFISDFWIFDSNVPRFVRGFPRWLMPGAYRARDRLHTAIKDWHAYALTHSDCSRIEKEDPEWEPYLGSKLLRARQNYWQKMEPMDSHARAADDLGLIMAANANAVPSTFWLMYEALRNDSLRGRMTREAASCIDSVGVIDLSRLSSQPLLQSAYAEVLRLRIAIGMTRQCETEHFKIGGYQIPKGEPVLIFSRHPALNEEAWALAGRPSTETGTPLTEFYAERFLVPKNSGARSQQQDQPSIGSWGQSSGEAERPTALPNNHGTDATVESEFSLDGLAGLWLPFGGGQRMCPGRHYAKNVIIGTFAFLISRYDMELSHATERYEPAESDLRWFPAGGLPPARRVPFRIRRKPWTAV